MNRFSVNFSPVAQVARVLNLLNLVKLHEEKRCSSSKLIQQVNPAFFETRTMMLF